MIRQFIFWTFGLDRGQKRVFQVLFDLFAITACFWLAMALRLDGISTEISAEMWSVLLGVFPVTIITFTLLGLYRAVIRYIADHAVRLILIGVVVSAVAMFVISQTLALGIPRSVPGIYLSLLLIAVGGSRFLMRFVFLLVTADNRKPVLIYGAGHNGVELFQAVVQSQNFRVALFVDDAPSRQGSVIKGVKVVHPDSAADNCATLQIRTALIALDKNDHDGQRRAAMHLSSIGLEVRTVPNVSDIVSGRIRVSELRRVTVEELLGRQTVPPIPELMSKTTHQKSVMVTGAGGSIGSELCRQILNQAPKNLILFENSEFALYQILEDLQSDLSHNSRHTTLVPVLGSITQTELVTRVIEENGVETLFHAAAYKHVPLVEANSLEGLRNNVFGTKTVAEAAGKLGVNNFTLISTDKAVRPTNVMGATKRIAELVMQDAASSYTNTKYCAVRFGNVLGSSGSVIPKFTKQIREGGPITLTDLDITRYFMTIPEAAQLVVQSSAMAKQGEIYLLDMGEPIKIAELACTMARLQGRNTYVEGTRPPEDGAIPIVVTGLRPGEKLYEELLIEDDAEQTMHPRIMREPAKKTAASQDTPRAIAALADALHADDVEKLVEILRNLPIEYSYPHA